MSEFRLDDSLLTTSVRYRHLTIHKVRNCIMRNIITPDAGSNMGYEHNLKQEDFIDGEYATILSLICCKDNYSLDDRNSLRRILLNRFDGWLWEGVRNEQFYNHVKQGSSLCRFICKKSQEVMELDEDNQCLFLVISGRVRVKNFKGVETVIGSGKYFGHEELLSGNTVCSLKFLEDCQLVYVPKKVFLEHLSDHFNTKLQRIQKEVCRYLQWTLPMTEYERIHFLLGLRKLPLKEGTVICSSGSIVKYIYFIVKGSFTPVDAVAASQFRAVGLQELVNGKDTVRFNDDIVCQTECEAFSIPLRTLRVCASCASLKQLMHMRTLNEFEKKEIRRMERRYQFRIKNAKIVLSRSSRRDNSIDSAMITNNFVFLSDRNDLIKDKLRIRKAKTETRHMSIISDDPEQQSIGLLPYL